MWTRYRSKDFWLEPLYNVNVSCPGRTPLLNILCYTYIDFMTVFNNRTLLSILSLEFLFKGQFKFAALILLDFFYSETSVQVYTQISYISFLVKLRYYLVKRLAPFWSNTLHISGLIYCPELYQSFSVVHMKWNYLL